MQDIEIFDTLGVSKKFREVGIPAEQAEVLVTEMSKLATKQPVSHQDLRQTEEKLLDEIREVRGEIKASEHRIMSWAEAKIEAQGNRQTIITIGGVAALLAIFQFLVPILS